MTETPPGAGAAPPGGSGPPGGRAARSPDALAALVSEHMEIVTFQARQLARQLGRYAAQDDLVSVGGEALVLAAQSHDPSLAPFAPYAMRKVRWAMLDFARRDTHARAAVARRRASAMMALEEVASVPADASVAPTEEDHLAAFRDAVAATAGALFMGLASAPEPASPDTPENDLIRARANMALKVALERLPERERQLIEGHYFRGERFDDMAEALQISKSRVSRLHTRALAALGELLKSHA